MSRSSDDDDHHDADRDARDDPHDDARDDPHHDGRDDVPIGVDTFVREERGRWIVEIAVAFPDGVVRRRVNTYPTRRRAEIAASWIRRGADRDIEGPIRD